MKSTYLVRVWAMGQIRDLQSSKSTFRCEGFSGAARTLQCSHEHQKCFQLSKRSGRTLKQDCAPKFNVNAH